LNGDVVVTGGRTTSVPVISKLPFEDAFLADLALNFFFLIGVLLGTAALPALEGGRLERGEGGLGLPSRPGEGADLTRIGLTITDWDLPLMIDDALEDDGLRFVLEVDTDLVGVFVEVLGSIFLPRIGLFVGTRVPEFFLGNFETGL